MELIDLLISGVLFSRKSNLWIADIKLTFRPNDRPFPQEINFKIRIKGNRSQSFQDVEAATLSEAALILSHANQILGGVGLEKLYEDIQKRLEIDEKNAQDEINRKYPLLNG